MGRRLLVYGAIVYAVSIGTLTLSLIVGVWIMGVWSATVIGQSFAALAVNAPGALLAIVLVGSMDEDDDWLSGRIVRGRRIWLGVGALALAAAVVLVGVMLAGPGYEDRTILGLPFALVAVILVPQLFLITIMAFGSIGVGIAELLGHDPLELGL